MTTPTRKHQKILIAGATSAIAREVARIYANQGHSIYLIGRREGYLKLLADDLGVRGASRVSFSSLDLNQFDEIEPVVASAFTFLGELDVALIFHGSLPDQVACEIDFEKACKEIHTNGLSQIALLTALNPRLKNQGSGCLAVVTSVAGDRGRQSNFVYGSAKAMVSTYLQGLRGSMHSSGVHVIDIRPGFVDSPMTAQFKKGLLWSSPGKIAGIIVKSISAGRHTVYAPFYWRYIMLVVRLIPEFLFKRMKL